MLNHVQYTLSLKKNFSNPSKTSYLEKNDQYSTNKEKYDGSVTWESIVDKVTGLTITQLELPESKES